MRPLHALYYSRYRACYNIMFLFSKPWDLVATGIELLGTIKIPNKFVDTAAADTVSRGFAGCHNFQSFQFVSYILTIHLHRDTVHFNVTLSKIY